MSMQDVFARRLTLIAGALIVLSVLLLARLVMIQFQMDPEVVDYFQRQASRAYVRVREYQPTRGQIYDRDGELLAVNTLEYEIGVNPPLITDPAQAARDLAVVLNADELAIYNLLTSDRSWALLARPVSAAIGQAVEDLDITGVEITPIPRRAYPQQMLGAQVIGFVASDGQGYYGVEGAYQRDLAGQSRVSEESAVPLEVSLQVTAGRGRDLVLTIDRDVQFLAESELQHAIQEYGAQRGTIIIMNPRNGEILAMASYPSFDPNTYYETVDENALINPAISEQYEPGSVFKILTMAAAIEEGVVLPGSTYNDQASIACGGVTINNWDNAAHGLIDMTQVLVQSLNVGTTTVVMSMGPERFYRRIVEFGIGQPTLVDLEGEASGTLLMPGDPGWQESTLCTNSFGQGLAVTPLQLLVAVSAIANGGLMMQPHVVHQIIDGETIHTTRPSPIGRPISAETARMVRDMLVQVVQYGVDRAQVPGYTVAGKSGTAQIPSPDGYEQGATIASFIGFLPADDPQVIILIKLDRPTASEWGSMTAAPAFARLAERLVILLQIPPDAERYELAARGGQIGMMNP